MSHRPSGVSCPSEKYRSTLERAGALVEVACVEEEIEEATTA